jgi:hypothetical protein
MRRVARDTRRPRRVWESEMCRPNLCNLPIYYHSTSEQHKSNQQPIGEASGAGGVNKKMKAAVATDVTVDLAGLDCTLCLDLLRPPVFQVS